MFETCGMCGNKINDGFQACGGCGAVKLPDKALKVASANYFQLGIALFLLDGIVFILASIDGEISLKGWVSLMLLSLATVLFFVWSSKTGKKAENNPKWYKRA